MKIAEVAIACAFVCVGLMTGCTSLETNREGSSFSPPRQTRPELERFVGGLSFGMSEEEVKAVMANAHPTANLLHVDGGDGRMLYGGGRLLEIDVFEWLFYFKNGRLIATYLAFDKPYGTRTSYSQIVDGFERAFGRPYSEIGRYGTLVYHIFRAEWRFPLNHALVISTDHSTKRVLVIFADLKFHDLNSQEIPESRIQELR